MKTTYSHIVLFARDFRTVASGWEGAPYLQEIRPGAGFKTGNFVEEKLGGPPQNDSLYVVYLMRYTETLVRLVLLIVFSYLIYI